MADQRRVVVTGMGALTPLGHNVNDYWNALKEGTPGATRISKFDPSQFRTQVACELKDFDAGDYLEHNTIRRTDPFTQYALIASNEAIEDSGLEMENMDPFDVGVIWGSGQGGMEVFEQEVRNYAENDYKPRFNPFFVPKLIVNMASGMISMQHGMMGVNYTAVSACATSNTAIMDALNYIRWGQADVIVTGGSEAGITEACVGGFSAMRAMSTHNDDPPRACRPFDVDRDGFVMGEGAAALVLEEYEHAKKRGATIYAEVAGASMTADAYHMTATHPEGKGAKEAMRRSLAEADIAPEEVDYLNCHATSTPVGDLSEIKATTSLFGENPKDLYISATKSMTGHLLGAAGAAEAVASIKSINEGVIPPTINTEEIDEEIPKTLNIVLKDAVETNVDIAMSNTFGFGGHNGIVVFRKV
ncbi:beta-ketoacyl-ACP synthase II [Aliifodinibius sp. S!AR15-10]|uniref:beta-ketoacyl-ACP synthase II n=1 Tax=Aliifodinibius sp. S!AR15-10 TaxID=2950437 RepID=UPI002855F95E|nr:beta-ketoacyl-ACP synthase II [Aliifodinibius sp. S!AR15-10]MDR8393704.1 beta-ketoacyl-ACP synthase II [Aliifodinibius sp. S!AR15-10]